MTVWPAVPLTLDAPDLHVNEPEPPVIAMVPEPMVSGAEIPAAGRDSTTTALPQSPAWLPFAARTRQFHSPGLAVMFSMPGEVPVRTMLPPRELHSSSHEVVEAPIKPTWTLSVFAADGGRGTRRGASGVTTESTASSAMSILSLIPAMDRVWKLAPSAKFPDEEHDVEVVVHLAVPAASRTMVDDAGRFISHRVTVPATRPGECPGWLHDTDPELRPVTTGRDGGLMFQNAE